MPKHEKTEESMKRFRPDVDENEKVRATRFFGLCKSCGECIVKCPVNAISWDEENLGVLGEPAIVIDVDTCIGCEICEQICPDNAIEITRKQPPAGQKQK